MKLLLCFLLFFCSFLYADDQEWPLKTLKSMTLEEKIGQLFMVAAYTDYEYAFKEVGDPYIIHEIDSYIAKYHIGGLAFVGPSEMKIQVMLTNHYQSLSKYPLLIAQDLEWGLAMRIKNALLFPKNSTLGSLNDPILTYEMGKEIGREAGLIGVHMNLSPVLDVNRERENISINVRSFGNSPEKVGILGCAMIKGLQDAGIIASAKHFPGLGNISTDPHFGLPCNVSSKERLHEVDLYPFQKAIEAGVLSIQNEHLIVPALDSKELPASLSPAIIKDLLKKEMGFEGLVLSGALRMRALTLNFPDEEIILGAFLAGNDMLLMPKDLPRAYETLKRAYEQGEISEKDIDARVLKILQLKERVHLDKDKIVPIPRSPELFPASAHALKELLFQKAVSLVRSEEGVLPISSQNEPIAYIQLGDAPSTVFLQLLENHFKIDSYHFPLDHYNLQKEQEILEKIKRYPLVVLGVYPADSCRIEQIRLLDEENLKKELEQFKVHGIPESLQQLIEKLGVYQDKTIVTYFGNPFGLHFFDAYSTLIMAYEPVEEAEKATFELLIK